MEIIDEKTPGKEDNVENIFFFIRENGEQHFLINFEMFLYIISDKSENYGKMWLKWRKLFEKAIGEIENGENSCSLCEKAEVIIVRQGSGRQGMGDFWDRIGNVIEENT